MKSDEIKLDTWADCWRLVWRALLVELHMGSCYARHFFLHPALDIRKDHRVVTESEGDSFGRLHLTQRFRIRCMCGKVFHNSLTDEEANRFDQVWAASECQRGNLGRNNRL